MDFTSKMTCNTKPTKIPKTRVANVRFVQQDDRRNAQYETRLTLNHTQYQQECQPYIKGEKAKFSKRPQANTQSFLPSATENKTNENSNYCLNAVKNRTNDHFRILIINAGFFRNKFRYFWRPLLNCIKCCLCSVSSTNKQHSVCSFTV